MLSEENSVDNNNVVETAGVCWKYENDVNEKMSRRSVGRRAQVRVRTVRPGGYENT